MVVHLIGVPFDSAGTISGVARAPAALRDAGLLDALQAVGAEVVDAGDVRLGPMSTERDPRSGIIAPEALTTMIGAVREAVATARNAGAFPLVIGGDCPILLGCLGADRDESRPGLLFVDGHEDAWPPLASTTGEAADMELGLLLGRSLDILPSALRDAIPLLTADRVVAIGPRDQREIADAGIESLEGIVDIVRTEELDAAALEGAVELRIERLAGLGSWWLHVDLDVLSTESLSAVDYRQPGGLEWPALTALTRRALGAAGVIGWSVTIYNPDLDPDRTGAAAIVRYLSDSFAGITPASWPSRRATPYPSRRGACRSFRRTSRRSWRRS